MSDLFACIGIDTDGAGGVASAVGALMERAAETIYRGGGSLFDWRDPSGAAVTVTTVTVDNVVHCVTPTFTAGLRTTAIATGFAPEQHCRFCAPMVTDVVDEDGNVVHAMPVRLEDAALTRNRVVPGQALTLAVAGLAEQVRVWPDESTYLAAQEGKRVTVPLGSVVPSGLYAAEASAHVIITGVVRVTDERPNEATGLPFRWAVLATDGGELEVVMPPQDVEPGNVVQAVCFVVGRVVAGLGEEQRPRFLSRRGR